MTMYLSGANLRQIFAFLLGGLEGSSWLRLAFAAPLVVGGSIAILARARALNGLLLCEETAAHLGVDVRRERGALLGLATLVTAAAVAVSGLIGFVGLVAPHLVRFRGDRTRGTSCPWRRSSAPCCWSPPTWRRASSERSRSAW